MTTIEPPEPVEPPEGEPDDDDDDNVDRPAKSQPPMGAGHVGMGS